MDKINFNEFREFGKAAVDFIADYLENIRERDVLPTVSPGYLHNFIRTEAPENSENWECILNDIKNIIVPGLTHWQSPNFHAYYPGETSFPSIVGEMLSAGFGVVGFNWICSPSCTELEIIVMDWIGNFLNLPEQFLNSSSGQGGGILQSSASEAILVSFLTAREQIVERIKITHPDLIESDVRGKLVAYSSDQANSCIEKASLLAAVQFRQLCTDDNLIFRGNILQKAIEEDISNGFIPFLCVATLGTTGTCSFDNISELGAICQANDIWFHVDAAYGGAIFSLPEYSYLKYGLEYANSINFNLHKLLRINFDCCAMWFRDSEKLVKSFNIDRDYLNHNYQNQSKQAPDYRNWEIPLGRRFRALKVWMTFRFYGAEGLRSFIRTHIALGQKFERYVENDDRFELVAKRIMGLVCFRVKGENYLTKELLNVLTEGKKIFLIESKHKKDIFLRFSICGFDPNESDIDFAWTEISKLTEMILINHNKLTNNKENEIKSDLDSIDDVSKKYIKNVSYLTQRLSKELILSKKNEKCNRL